MNAVVKMKPDWTIRAAAVVLCALAVPAQAAAGLPGGATSLNEAHADWTLGCNTPTQAAGGAVQCAVSQAQFDKASKRRVLTIVINPQAGGSVKGMLVMPFGLSLDKGVTFQLDAGAVTPAAHFRTCLPAGCLVALDWPEATAKAMRSATTLKVSAVSDNGQPAPFSISLNGFASAMDRAIALPAKQ